MQFVQAKEKHDFQRLILSRSIVAGIVAGVLYRSVAAFVLRTLLQNRRTLRATRPDCLVFGLQGAGNVLYGKGACTPLSDDARQEVSKRAASFQNVRGRFFGHKHETVMINIHLLSLLLFRYLEVCFRENNATAMAPGLRLPQGLS